MGTSGHSCGRGVREWRWPSHVMHRLHMPRLVLGLAAPSPHRPPAGQGQQWAHARTSFTSFTRLGVSFPHSAPHSKLAVGRWESGRVHGQDSQPKGFSILYALFLVKKAGRGGGRGMFVVVVFVLHIQATAGRAEAQLSRKGLDICPPVASSEWIPSFTSQAHTAFASPIKPSLPHPQVSSPSFCFLSIPWQRAVSVWQAGVRPWAAERLLLLSASAGSPLREHLRLQVAPVAASTWISS